MYFSEYNYYFTWEHRWARGWKIPRRRWQSSLDVKIQSPSTPVQQGLARQQKVHYYFKIKYIVVETHLYSYIAYEDIKIYCLIFGYDLVQDKSKNNIYYWQSV